MEVCSNVEERRFSAASSVHKQCGLQPLWSDSCLLDRLRHVERRRLQSQQAPVRHVVERRSQAAIVVIFERDKAEWLEDSVLRLPHGTQYLSHGSYRAGLRLKCNFDEVALCKRTRQSQQSAGRRDGLKFSVSVPAIFEANRSQDRSPKLDPGRAPRRVRLGEVGHKIYALWHALRTGNRLRKQSVRIPAPHAAFQPQHTHCHEDAGCLIKS